MVVHGNRALEGRRGAETEAQAKRGGVWEGRVKPRKWVKEGGRPEGRLRGRVVHSAYRPDAGGARAPSHATSARMPITQAVSTARLTRSAVSAPPWSFMAIERSKAGVRRNRLSDACPSIAANKTRLQSSTRP